MKKIFLLCSLPLALSANSFFNGSFELGTDGFAVERELRTDVNPSREFIPLKLSAGAMRLPWRIPVRNTSPFSPKSSG